MTLTFSIEWLFFIIPLLVLFIVSIQLDDTNGFMGSERSWFLIFFGPATLGICFALWAVYLKFFN